MLASHITTHRQINIILETIHEGLSALQERLDRVHRRADQGIEISIKIKEMTRNLEIVGRIQHHYLDNPMEEITKVNNK